MPESTQSPAIVHARRFLETLRADEEARLLAESREKGRRDFEDRIESSGWNDEV
jgi:hypothetical protein